MGILDRIAGTLDGLTGGDEVAREIAEARAREAEGDSPGAEALLTAVTARAPRAAFAFLALGELRAKRGALEEAVAAFGRAVDLDGDDVGAWLGLGEALGGLDRREPARDALRRALALTTQPAQRARAHAALGKVHAASGKLARAERELAKALELGALAADDEAALALAYGRVLAKLGDARASEWLTRAARAPGADPGIFAEAAAATPDGPRAEALIDEGLTRAPGALDLRAARVRSLVRRGHAEEAVALAEEICAELPDSPRAWSALREACIAAGRWPRALAAATNEDRLGAAPPLSARVALALGAEDVDALAAIGRSTPGTAAAQETATREALRGFTGGHPRPADLLTLGRLAPNDSARRFVARRGAPAAPPEGQLAALLGWANEFAASEPSLAGAAAGMARAADALDRPLLVAVMGEFNAGKSSFVNAYCGEEVAATGVTPTTATINVLRYAETPEVRVVHLDGTSRTIPIGAFPAILAAFTDGDAREIRLTEIFLPVEALRRVEIVDTPGLNSIRPEHERVARDFLQDADAIVWVLAVGQAAKATEKEALSAAHVAGKRVIAVLNKIDRAEPAEVAAVLDHVRQALGGLVDSIVPFSATEVLAARRAGRPSPAFEALTAALERSFFADARALKRATALGALRRFVEAARLARPDDDSPQTAADVRVELTALGERLSSSVDAERIALRARIEDHTRRAALEVRDLVQRRAGLFGERRVTADEEDLLIEILEDALGRATDRSRVVLLEAVAGESEHAPTSIDGAQGLLSATRARAAEAIEGAINRFAAYASGFITGGAVPELLRQHLPRASSEIAAIAEALRRRAPDPEQRLFAPLKRDLAEILRRAEEELAASELDAHLRALLHDERMRRPLESLAQALAALA